MSSTERRRTRCNEHSKRADPLVVICGRGVHAEQRATLLRSRQLTQMLFPILRIHSKVRCARHNGCGSCCRIAGAEYSMDYQNLAAVELARLCVEKDAEAWLEFVRRNQRSITLVI